MAAMMENPMHDMEFTAGFEGGFVGGTEFPIVPVGPERPQYCNMRHM